MSDDTGAILLDLLYADKAAAAERYREIHQWRYDQELARARAFIGTAVTLATALVLSELKDELHASWTLIAYAFYACFVIAFIGVEFYVRAIRMPRDYAAVLRLLKSLEGLVP